MPSLAALYVVCVIDVLGFGIMVPLVPFMAHYFGVSPALLTPLLGVYALCQLIATPIWGRLSDRYGRRPILISSMGGACISYLMLGFAPNIWWVLAARVLGGFMAGNLATIMAYASARFRDLPHGMTALLQVLFFMTPVFFTVDVLKQRQLDFVYAYNPLYYLIEVVRHPLVKLEAAPLFVYEATALYLLVMLIVTAFVVSKLDRRIVYLL